MAYYLIPIHKIVNYLVPATIYILTIEFRDCKVVDHMSYISSDVTLVTQQKTNSNNNFFEYFFFRTVYTWNKLINCHWIYEKSARTPHFVICLTKTTAAQNEDALSYYRVRGLYFMAVVFERSIEVNTRRTRGPGDQRTRGPEDRIWCVIILLMRAK